MKSSKSTPPIHLVGLIPARGAEGLGQHLLTWRLGSYLFTVRRLKREFRLPLSTPISRIRSWCFLAMRLLRSAGRFFRLPVSVTLVGPRSRTNICPFCMDPHLVPKLLIAKYFTRRGTRAYTVLARNLAPIYDIETACAPCPWFRATIRRAYTSPGLAGEGTFGAMSLIGLDARVRFRRLDAASWPSLIALSTSI